MTDGLLTYDEAATLWQESVEVMFEQDPDAARSLLGLSSDAPLELSEDLLRRGAWTGMLTRAVEVRCKHECDHDQRYGWLRFGLLVCRDCATERFAGLAPRGDDDCDVCGADARVFVAVEHRSATAARAGAGVRRLWRARALARAASRTVPEPN